MPGANEMLPTPTPFHRPQHLAPAAVGGHSYELLMKSLDVTSVGRPMVTALFLQTIRPPAVNGDRALTAPIYSPSQFLALPPAPSLEQPENKTMPEIKEGTKENQDTPILTLEHPDLQQPLH